MSCREAAKRLGGSPGTVVNWVRRFERSGFADLSDPEGGSRLGAAKKK
jgi:transposase